MTSFLLWREEELPFLAVMKAESSAHATNSTPGHVLGVGESVSKSTCQTAEL